MPSISAISSAVVKLFLAVVPRATDEYAFFLADATVRGYLAAFSVTSALFLALTSGFQLLTQSFIVTVFTSV